MASTSVHDLLKRAGIKKIQLEETKKQFTTNTRKFKYLYVQINTV